jgi:phosphoribosyl 1,2-cyclic phosphate phosphodiesterase
VAPVLVEHLPNYESMLAVAREQRLARGFAQSGDRLVVTAGVPFDVGTTNLLKIGLVAACGSFLGTGAPPSACRRSAVAAQCAAPPTHGPAHPLGALLESGGTTLLLDTPPELRLQLLAAGVSLVDAVLYTHEHADHTGGIDDLRIFTVRRRSHLPVYGPAETLAMLERTYRYIFDSSVTAFEGTSKPHLEPRPLEPGQAVEIGAVPVLPLAFPHGNLRVFGYRFGPVAYLTDVKEVGPAAEAALRGLDVLVLNALWWRPHPP